MEPQLLDSSADILAQLADDSDACVNGYPVSRCSDSLVIRDAINESAMTADFVIVTRSKDINRNGHKVTISPDEESGAAGLMLNNFNKNPVVLWNHGFGGVPFPIAKSGDVRLLKTKAEAQAQFSQSLPEAAQIFALIAEGILNTTSISFLPMKARLFKPDQQKLADDETDFSRGYAFDFLSNDLLEWSVVDIPADPGAVRKCLERGTIKGEKITQSLKPALVRMAGDKKLIVPGWTCRDGAGHEHKNEIEALKCNVESLQRQYSAIAVDAAHVAGERDELVLAAGYMGDMLNAAHAVKQAAADKAKEQERLTNVAGQVSQQLRSALNGVEQSIKGLRTEIDMLTGRY